MALLFGTVIPTGFMPDLEALQHGVLKIRICTAEGAQDIFVDRDLKKSAPQDHKIPAKKMAPCPFGATPSFAILTAAIFLAAFFYVIRLCCDKAPVDNARIRVLSSWPRGPPRL